MSSTSSSVNESAVEPGLLPDSIIQSFRRVVLCFAVVHFNLDLGPVIADLLARLAISAETRAFLNRNLPSCSRRCRSLRPREATLLSLACQKVTYLDWDRIRTLGVSHGAAVRAKTVATSSDSSGSALSRYIQLSAQMSLRSHHHHGRMTKANVGTPSAASSW